jgi:hypothetical protein
VETQHVKFVQVNSQFPVDSHHAAKDLVIAVYEVCILCTGPHFHSEDFHSHICLWVQMIEAAFEQNATLIYNLPIECQDPSKVHQLLEVLLA